MGGINLRIRTKLVLKPTEKLFHTTKPGSLRPPNVKERAGRIDNVDLGSKNYIISSQFTEQSFLNNPCPLLFESEEFIKCLFCKAVSHCSLWIHLPALRTDRHLKDKKMKVCTPD